MEPIEVTAHFDLQGTLTPLKFIWWGSTRQVESTGRRWVDEHGQHMLVMLPGGRIYQLTLILAEGRWYVHPGQADHSVV